MQNAPPTPMPASTPIPTSLALGDDVKIEDVIGSPKAIKALKAKGINKIGDIRSIAEVAAIPGMTAGALAQLSELNTVKKESPKAVVEIEEGPHPIVLRSKFPAYILRLLGGDIVAPSPGMPGSPRILQPIAVFFKDGNATLTRETWVTAIHRRDPVKIAAELAKDPVEVPWRGPAISWLRSKRTHKQGNFIVLE